jgi:hypothetical protein
VHIGSTLQGIEAPTRNSELDLSYVPGLIVVREGLIVVREALIVVREASLSRRS